MTLDEAIALLPTTDTITVYHDAPLPEHRDDLPRDQVLTLVNESEDRGLWNGNIGEMLVILADWDMMFIDIGRMKQEERSRK